MGRPARFSLPGAPTYECAGKHVALLGQGDIGRVIRRSLEALGMIVHPVQLPGRPAKPGYLTMDQALPQAAIVVLACPLTDSTCHLINAEILSLLPASCHIVNIARGPLVDEQALLSACHERPGLFYSSDVLSTEPPPQIIRFLITIRSHSHHTSRGRLLRRDYVYGT